MFRCFRDCLLERIAGPGGLQSKVLLSEGPELVGTTGDISGDLVRDLIAEAIEACFGPVNRVPAQIQWLSDNGPRQVAH